MGRNIKDNDEMRIIKEMLEDEIEDLQRARNAARTQSDATYYTAVDKLDALFMVLGKIRMIVTGSGDGEWPEGWDNKIAEESKSQILAVYPKAFAEQISPDSWIVKTNSVSGVAKGITENLAWIKARRHLSDLRALGVTTWFESTPNDA